MATKYLFTKLFTLVLIVLFINPVFAQFVQQGGKLVGAGAIGAAYQGKCVAISSDGLTAIVGGYNDDGALGAAWVFTRNGETWSQQGSKLVGSGAVGPSRQGAGVALSSDGNTAIIGGYMDNGGVGAAWIFSRSGSVWSQQGNKLVGSGVVGNATQGISVSISGDGNTAMIGGQLDNNNTGAVWVFVRTDSGWSQQGNKLVGTGAVGSAQQGQSIGLSEDGNTAIIGAAFDSNAVGAVWCFTRNTGVWTQLGGKLVGTGFVGSSVQGARVALSSDGNTALVGGHYDNGYHGAVWVYTRSGGVWSQQGSKLTPSDAVGSAWFGRWVSLSADGNTAVFGGPFDNGNIGALWVFKNHGGVWSQYGNKLIGSGGVGNTQQGGAVSTSGDGSIILEGGEGDNGSTGAAWVFKFDSSSIAAKWSFDEPTGTFVSDSSRFGNNGTAFGTSIVGGRFGNARYFDGVSDYVNVPNPEDGSLNFRSEQSFTVDAWFKTTGEQGHIIRRGLSPVPGFLIGVYYGHIAAVIGDFDGANSIDTVLMIVSNQLYNDDIWHHVTLVRDRKVKKIYLYVDNVQSTTPINDNFNLPLVSDRPLTIGRWENPSFPGYFHGSIDEVIISKSANHPASAYVPIIDLKPTTVNFGLTMVNDTARKEVSVSNTGIRDTLIVTNITASNGVFIPAINSAEIPPGSTKIFDLLYAPVSVHVDTTTLFVTSNDPGSPMAAIHLSGQGYLPTQEPLITGIRDVANDQGREVRVIWSRSVYDGIVDSQSVTEYDLWRRVDETSSKSLQGKHPEGQIFYSSGHRLFFSKNELWDYIVRVPAVGFKQYAFVSPTLADSTSGTGIRWSVFKVSAQLNSGMYLFSPPDSGYSVDNLSPSSPSHVSLTVAPGANSLTWDEGNDQDVEYFTIYGGTVRSFIPDATSIIGTSHANYFIDKSVTGSETMYYRIRAVDKSGNQSNYSVEVGGSVTDIGDGITIPTEFKLFQNYPNPFNPSTKITFDVAKEGIVVLKIYNLLGQEVATLTNQKMRSGHYELSWNAQHVPSGLYLLRMNAGTYSSVIKVLFLK